jgi:hypothetical protein
LEQGRKTTLRKLKDIRSRKKTSSAFNENSSSETEGGKKTGTGFATARPNRKGARRLAMLRPYKDEEQGVVIEGWVDVMRVRGMIPMQTGKKHWKEDA